MDDQQVLHGTSPLAGAPWSEPGRVSALAGLARITAPTLVLDGGASPDWMRAAAAAVGATVPGATYSTVPGEDHAILRRPEVLAAEISRG